MFGKSETGDDEEEDTDTICPKLHQSWVEPLGLPGGHHFDGNYAGLTQHIIRRIEQIKTGH